MLRPSSKFFFALISLIESKFETPPITEVEALLLARESCANRHQTKFFPPSVHYSHSPSKSFVGGSFSVVVPNMVVVCMFVVVVVVVAMSISNAKFDLNMATWQMFAFIGVILLFSLLILLCSMIPPLIKLSPLPLLPLHPKSLILGSIHLHNLFLKFQLLCLPIQILTLLHLDTRF